MHSCTHCIDVCHVMTSVECQSCTDGVKAGHLQCHAPPSEKRSKRSEMCIVSQSQHVKNKQKCWLRTWNWTSSKGEEFCKAISLTNTKGQNELYPKHRHHQKGLAQSIKDRIRHRLVIKSVLYTLMSRKLVMCQNNMTKKEHVAQTRCAFNANMEFQISPYKLELIHQDKPAPTQHIRTVNKVTWQQQRKLRGLGFDS